MAERLLIRADGGARIGTGHVMRCVSLAQGWRRAAGEVIFALAESSPGLEQRLQTEGCEFLRLNVPAGGAEDAAQTVLLSRQRDAVWVVADGYHFGADYQRTIKAAGLRLLLFDDYGHADHYSADMVLNQNLHAKADFYARREPHTRLLLGTRYVLLRQQFLRYRGWQRETPAVARKLLVTLGGADPGNITGKVIERLRGLDVEAKIVVGGSNPHLEKLQSAVCGLRAAMQLVVDAPDMPELMAWADVAVAAGGTTSWELAFMGLPSLVLVLADNQQPVADALDEARLSRKTTPDRLAADLGALLADAGARRAMSERGRQLVDGNGVSRVVAGLREADLVLRRVGPDDCRRIWEWANDPNARAVSFSQEPIPWETHVKWFEARLASANCRFYLAANGQQHPVGRVRFDLNGTEAVVSVSVAPEARGRGCGVALIVRGSELCFAESPATLIHAYVLPQNEASSRAFESAGYADAGMEEMHGRACRHFVLRKENAP